MTVVNQASAKQEKWSFLNRVHGEGVRGYEIGAALAALIYLRWADFQEAEQEAIAAFDDTHYEPVLPASLHWRTWHQLPPDRLVRFVKEDLPGALEKLGNARHSVIATNLHRIAKALEPLSRLSAEGLTRVVRGLAELPFETPSDRRQLLDVFDTVLDVAVGKHLGEHRTPPEVARLIVELAAPAAGDHVHDPCFGSAGLLTAAWEYVLEREKDEFARSGKPALTVSGIELDPGAYTIGLTRLVLAGIDEPQLELGNSLERTPTASPQSDGFDVVVANPPWGGRIDPTGLGHFPVRTSDSTGLFIQHALSQLRPEGRAVLVVPEGFLFQGGPVRELRKLLVERHTVDAVVSLPAGAFWPLTRIKANMLVLRKGGATNKLRMVAASPFFEQGNNKHAATIRCAPASELAKRVRDPSPGKHCWDVAAETLAESDWDFSVLRRDRSALRDLLDSLRHRIYIGKLRECCGITSGRSIPWDQLIDEHGRPAQEWLFPGQSEPQQQKLFDADVVPYVRIRDLRRGRASRVTSWLAPGAAASLGRTWKLRAGDVLLSKSGTVGKVGLVCNGALGGIAASGLFVLRADHERLDPHFLVAYLQSGECRSWLDERARGATIRHLSKRILEDLPVPLLPLQLQQRVAERHREDGIDALACLSQLLTEDKSDPIAEWLPDALKILSPETENIQEPLNLLPLDRLAGDLVPLRNRVAHDPHAQGSLAGWLLTFTKAMSLLKGAPDVPRGPSLLSLLQESTRGIREAEEQVKGNLPLEAKARALTGVVHKRLEAAIEALLAEVRLLFSIGTNTMRVGEMQEMDLEVRNQGPLALRDVQIDTEPDWGQASFAYLAENGTEVLALSGAAPKKRGTFSLSVRWAATTLDGQEEQGTRELAFEVLDEPSPKADQAADLGGSPYVCGDPIRPDRKDVFFGREELLEQIRRQVVQSGNVVLLEGNRRAGKSSILRHLEGIGPVPGWLGVYCSLQGAEGSRDGVGVPTAGVFREFARTIARSLHALGGDTPLPDGSRLPAGMRSGIPKACREGIGEASPFADLREYLEVALEVLEKRGLGLLLMLDEFDKLQEGIDNGITSPQVPENIRFLVQTYPRFSAILTGSRRLKRLREEYWSALFGLGTRFGVSSLPPAAARRLVTEPVKGRLTYSREAVELAITLTAGQPYLLQCLCNRVFDTAAQLKTRSITLDLIDQAGEVLVEDNEHFAFLWDYVGSDRRRFILALCHREAEGPDPFRLGVIQERLSGHGIEVNDKTLISDLDCLRESELIELAGEANGGHYALAIPLMGRWIDKQKDFAALQTEARNETEDQRD